MEVGGHGMPGRVEDARARIADARAGRTAGPRAVLTCPIDPYSQPRSASIEGQHDGTVQEENTMPKFVIGREIPGAGQLSERDLKAISQKSVRALDQLGSQVQWLQSYVTADKSIASTSRRARR